MVIGLADFHCDVLSKLLTDETIDFAAGDERLDVSYERLIDSHTIFQMFAIYIPEREQNGIYPILRSIDLFHRKIMSLPQMAFIQNAGQLRSALLQRRIGAMLSLEGVDGLQGDFTLLRILYHLGVRAVGITWNSANWAADGIMEPRQGGLTKKGKRLVEHCNQMGILLDVSHLSDKGFWELADCTEKPFIASHSNARSVCEHARNLNDEQIRAIIAIEGRIGVTFVPWFVAKQEPATIDDLLRHIEHICALGGERHVMIGSDFDGIERHIQRLAHPGEVENLIEALLKRYTQEQVILFLQGNAIRYLSTHLPKS